MWRLALYLSLTLAARSADLHGIVMDDRTRTPIPHAKVFFHSDKTIRLGLITDKNGEFHANTLPPANYEVRCFARDYLEKRYGDTTFGLFPPLLIHIDDNTQLPPLRIYMSPSASLSGKLLDLDGEPIENKSLTMYREELRMHRTYFRELTAHTDSEGSFYLSPLPEGRYSLVVSDPNLRLAQLDIARSTRHTIREFRLQPPKLYSITGKLDLPPGFPPHGYLVTLAPQGKPPRLRDVLEYVFDYDGETASLRLDGVPVGTYDLQVAQRTPSNDKPLHRQVVEITTDLANLHVVVPPQNLPKPPPPAPPSAHLKLTATHPFAAFAWIIPATGPLPPIQAQDLHQITALEPATISLPQGDYRILVFTDVPIHLLDNPSLLAQAQPVSLRANKTTNIQPPTLTDEDLN